MTMTLSYVNNFKVLPMTGEDNSGLMLCELQKSQLTETTIGRNHNWQKPQLTETTINGTRNYSYQNSQLTETTININHN